MTRYAMLSIALLVAAPAAAQDPLQPLDEAPPGAPPATVIDPDVNPQDFDLARRKVVDCEGEKFVFAWGAGAKPTKVTLCSKKNATRDELVQMLDDAATKLEQSNIPEDRRFAIVQQIRAKISELKGASASASAPAATREPPAAVARVPAAPPKVTPPTTVAPVVSQAPARAAAPVLAAKPRLALECMTPGEFLGGGPCVTLTRDTILTVKSGEALPGGLSLRFVRGGQTRAEVALSQMRKGQSVRLTIPRQLCSGVVESEAEIRIARGASVVDTVGPYLLRC